MQKYYPGGKMSAPPSQKNTEINSQLFLHREQSCSEDFSPSFLSCLFRKSRGTGKPSTDPCSSSSLQGQAPSWGTPQTPQSQRRTPGTDTSSALTSSSAIHQEHFSFSVKSLQPSSISHSAKGILPILCTL